MHRNQAYWPDGGVGDLLASPLTLNWGRQKRDAQMGGAPLQCAEDVAECCCLRAGDNGKVTGKNGQKALGFGCKEPFGFQLCLETQEAFKKIALACPPNGFDVELKFAAGFVEGNQRTRFDFLPVFQPPTEQLCPTAPHDAADLGAGVFQGKVNMA